MAEDLIRMSGVVKVYPPSTLALDHVDINIKKGEIHSVIGENGAGKSTLMKVLYGMLPANSGEIYYRGAKVNFSSPREAVKAGIGMVHQEFMLIPSYTVYENVILGSEPVGALGTLRDSEAKARVQSLIDEYGLNLRADARVKDISVAAQQKVEILKLLYRDVDVLIMDEPTAVLTPQEIVELFARLRDLKNSGKTVIFISHKLDEVLELSDTITVMRRGRRVTTVKNEGLTKSDLARAMVGRDVVFSVEKAPARPGESVFEVKGLTYVDANGQKRLSDVSFSVRRGEIVGLAGVEGNGQFELVQIITGLAKATAGQVLIKGSDVTNSDVMARRRLMSYVPQDRKVSGSAQKLSLVDNAIMTHHQINPSLSGRFRALLNVGRARKFTRELISEFGVVAPGIDSPISSLSGGNQQKVIVGREFLLGNDFILLDQPTRGLDVGSIEYIQKEIVRKRDAGAGCLLISADLDELFSLSDRILVIHRGRIVAEALPQEITKEEIGEYMLGAKGGHVRG